MPGWIVLLSYECLGHGRNIAIGLLGATLAALSLLAVNVGIQQLELEHAQSAHLLKERERDRASGRPPTGSLGAALRAVRLPVPGTVLVRGLGRTSPTYWDPTAAGLMEGPISASVDRQSELGPLFDLEGVLRVVLGLLALLIGIRTVSGPRSNQTLQTLLDLPMSRSSLALVKLAGAILTVGILLGLVSAGVLVLIAMRAPALLGTELPAMVGISWTVALMYGSVLAAAGMVIGSVATNPTTAGSLGIALWGILSLVYPQVIQLGTHVVAPIPLRAVVEDELTTVQGSRHAATLNLLAETAGRMRATPADALPPIETLRERLKAPWEADTAETRLMLSAIEQRAQSAVSRHDRINDLLALPNPAMLHSRILAAMAGTGATATADWKRALADYQARIAVAYYDDPPRLTLLVPTDTASDRVLFERRSIPTFADLPRFEPPVKDLRARLYDARLDLALLLAFMVVTSSLAIACFPSSGT